MSITQSRLNECAGRGLMPCTPGCRTLCVMQYSTMGAPLDAHRWIDRVMQARSCVKVGVFISYRPKRHARTSGMSQRSLLACKRPARAMVVAPPSGGALVMRSRIEAARDGGLDEDDGVSAAAGN